MVEKIQGNFSNDISSEAVRISKASGKSNQQKADKTDQSSSVEVSFSREALNMQKILQAAKETPEVRTDVVSHIQQDLKSGNYKVDKEALAARLQSMMK
jgi:flagellar biosynthesis anti-sigma factor FlgM